MPDHVHILFTLGARLRLGQVVAKFKSLAHNHGLAPWRWQEESFEHRLRPVESIEDYAFYIFMNPYCAGLTMPTQRWPWWFCPAGEQFRFLSLIQREAGIPPEWIKDAQAISKRLALRRPAEWK